MLHAVVIGINEYRDPQIPRLAFATSDAVAFADAINNNLHEADRSVHVLLDSDATHGEIRSAIGIDLPQRANMQNDIVMIYFAGHGSPETVGGVDDVSRYLVAHDTEHDRIFSTAIDLEREIQQVFQRISEPKLVVMFVDACFSGRAGGRTFEGPTLRVARRRYRGGRARLHNLVLGEGRFILSACDDSELASERNDLRHGLFTYALLRVLTSLASSDDPTIGVGDLYERVRGLVLRESNGRQRPVLNGRLAGARLPLFLPQGETAGQ